MGYVEEIMQKWLTLTRTNTPHQALQASGEMRCLSDSEIDAVSGGLLNQQNNNSGANQLGVLALVTNNIALLNFGGVGIL